MLPKEFREQLKERLLNLHWKQWTSFGVSSHMDRSEGFILDLEALAVSTLTISPLDRRLFEASLEWGRLNRSWLNLNRVKRIGRFFVDQGREGPLGDEVLESLLGFLKTSSPRILNGPGTKDADRHGHQGMFTEFKVRGIVVEPDVNLPCLQQLYQRSLFGVDARAEMFLYFLAGKKGNSNMISREIFMEQKNLYRIINHWLGAGILEGSPGGGNTGLALRDTDAWMKTLRVRKLPEYVNWPRIYRFLARLVLKLPSPVLQDDTYLVSSFFRDILEEGKYPASVARVDMPLEKSFPGKSFFEPYAAAVLKIAERLEG